jgi:putative sterol carrier protein
MSDVLNAAVAALQAKLDGNGLDGSLKIDISDEGSIRVEGETAEVSDADADCTLSADADTFQGMLSGDVDPTAAFMTGKLSVDGDMGVAMKLAGVLA